MLVPVGGFSVESSDGRVLILVLVATVVFFVGRRFQRTVDAWLGWGKAVSAAAEAAAKITDAKSAAWSAVRGMVVAGAVTLVFLAVIVNAVRSG